jgi:hypothetical protein
MRLSCILVGGIVAFASEVPTASGCCAVYPVGSPVVNADQTVIVIWDPATKTQHFIRQASFKSEADDFGFLVPSPNKPELSESGSDAFPYLKKLTAPAVVKRKFKPKAFGGSGGFGAGAMEPVKVLEEKRVAGFDAVVLEANSADALVDWLKQRGYVFSPEVKAWAQPYVDAGWKITALKVAKKSKGKSEKGKKGVAGVDAAALRMSFTTDYPLFPYREPDSKAAAESLGAKQRLLRIYFLSDARYEGKLGEDAEWTGKAVWSQKIAASDRRRILVQLKLPQSTGPRVWWLTEFEDKWAYRPAPGDLTFSRSRDQTEFAREPVYQ